MDHIYDVIILGAGPAGLSAGLYAGRSRLDTLIIEKGQAGGQIINTDEIENYPGQIVEGETGVSLVRRMYEQTEQFGAEHVRDTITNAELSGDIKVLTGEKDTYQAKNIIIATGAYARPVGCKGEQEYKGRGISYCATCDANFFTDLEVYVAGGGDAAVEEALYLTKFARKVTIIHRRDELRAAKSIQEKAFANPKITFLWDSVVEEVGGDGLLQTMTVKNVKTGELTKIEADPKDGLFGLFGFIGMIPNIGVFADKDYEKVIELTAPLAKRIVTVQTPDNPRALPAEVLKKAVEKVNPNVTSADSVAKAVEEVKEMTTKDDVVIVFGSLSFLSLADEAWNR